MDLDHVRSEIEHMRVQVGRQRKEILQLQRAGISTASAELLLVRMLAKIEGPVRRAGPAQEGAGRSDERARAWRPELVMRRTTEMVRRKGWTIRRGSTRSPNCASGPRVKATAINTSRRSPLRSTSTQRRRWVTATTFPTSLTTSASLTTLAIEPAGSCWRAFFG